MKKVLIFTLTLILIGSVFVSSIFAASDSQPLTAYGPPSWSGFWSPVSGTISGAFATWETDYNQIFSHLYSPTGTGWSILRDDRVNGIGNVFWTITVEFTNGFAFWSDYFIPPLVPVAYYDRIEIVIMTVNNEQVGYLNDFNLLGSDLKTVLFHSDGPDGDVDYILGGTLFFDSSGTNTIMAPFVDYEEIFAFYRDFFSGIPVDGQLSDLGFLKPVKFVSSSSEDPDQPDQPDDSPVGGFTNFMRLIVSAFASLLEIDFFGGFFSLGDLLGAIVAFSLLSLFIKWFAGG